MSTCNLCCAAFYKGHMLDCTAGCHVFREPAFRPTSYMSEVESVSLAVLDGRVTMLRSSGRACQVLHAGQKANAFCICCHSLACSNTQQHSIPVLKGRTKGQRRL